MRHGWGKLVWADGNTYEGGWRNDNISPGTKGLVKPAEAPRASVPSSPRFAGLPGLEGLQVGDDAPQSPPPPPRSY